MAKEIQSRLPRAQQRVTQQYSAPNPRAPQRPADLAQPAPYDPSLANAANRLLASLNQFGQKVEAQAFQRVDEEERIRIAKMTHAEAEEELRKQARAAEQQGIIAFGTNPFRIKVAQQYAAERVMRASFHDALTKSTHQFSNPLNTKANAEQFARDTFQQMEFPGHFAQARAAELYSEMTTQWLSQVRQQRSARAVRQNQEDLRNGVFGVLQEYDSGDMAGGYNELVERIQTMSDEYYSLAGDAGREHVISGVEAYMRNAIGQALKDNDEDDLRELRSLYERLSDQEGEDDFDLPDVFKWGTQHSESWAQIDSLLDQAEDGIGDISQERFEEGQKLAVRLAGSWMHSQGDVAISTDPSSDQAAALREHLIKEGVPPQAADDYIYGGTYAQKAAAHGSARAYIDRSVSDRLRNEVLKTEDNQQRQALITTLVASAVDSGEVAEHAATGLENELLTLHNRMSRERDMSMALRARSTQVAASQTIIGNQVAASTDLLQNEAEGSGVIHQISVGLQEWLNARLEVVESQQYASDEEREAAVNAEAERFNADVADIGGSRATMHDLEAARTKGAPDGLIDGWAAHNHALNNERLISDRRAIRLEGMDDAGDVGLSGGWAWRTAYIDNIDDVTDLYGRIATAASAGRTDIASSDRITAYNAETHQDAKAALAEFRDEGSSMMTEDGLISPVIRADGVYTQFGGEFRTTDLLNQRYLQALRLSGLTPEMMRANADEAGLDFDNFKELHDPYRTLMVNADNFVADVEEIAGINTKSMPQSELMQRLPDNPIVLHYQAYVEMVGENNAIGLTDFIVQTVEGIGRYTLPYADYEAILNNTDE